MAERALRNALEQYNNTIENNYKTNWGSLLTFLGKITLLSDKIFVPDGKDTQMLTQKAS